MSPIDLPEPETDGTTSVERAIATRTSRRSFARAPLGIEDVSQVLWAAQGLTHRRDGSELRAAPSAGATYPLVAFLGIAPDGVDELDSGLYRYEPGIHALESERETLAHEALARAAYGQAVVGEAPAVLVLTGAFGRTRAEYPERGDRYVELEAGHAAENVLLVCEARTLGCCPVGAFAEGAVADALNLPKGLEVLYLVPFGNRPSNQ